MKSFEYKNKHTTCPCYVDRYLNLNWIAGTGPYIRDSKYVSVNTGNLKLDNRESICYQCLIFFIGL